MPIPPLLPRLDSSDISKVGSTTSNAVLPAKARATKSAAPVRPVPPRRDEIPAPR
jgi:hypothetical protein